MLELTANGLGVFLLYIWKKKWQSLFQNCFRTPALGKQWSLRKPQMSYTSVRGTLVPSLVASLREESLPLPLLPREWGGKPLSRCKAFNANGWAARCVLHIVCSGMLLPLLPFLWNSVAWRKGPKWQRQSLPHLITEKSSDSTASKKTCW